MSPVADPDAVLAALRDPDSGLMPVQIGVFCDTCGVDVVADYLVAVDSTKAERLEVARANLREQGWLCTGLGDQCPACRPAPSGPRAGRQAATELLAAGEHVHFVADGGTECMNRLCTVYDLLP